MLSVRSHPVPTRISHPHTTPRCVDDDDVNPQKFVVSKIQMHQAKTLGMQASIFGAWINWEGCGRKRIQHKNGG